MAIHTYGIKIRKNGHKFNVSTYDELTVASQNLDVSCRQGMEKAPKEVVNTIRHNLNTDETIKAISGWTWDMDSSDPVYKIVRDAFISYYRVLWRGGFDCYIDTDCEPGGKTFFLIEVESDDNEAEDYLEMVERREWWNLPDRAPSNNDEIISLAASEWSRSEVFDDGYDLPNWLKQGILDEHDRRDAEAWRKHSGYYYGYGTPEPDFDYAYNDSRYAEDSWAAYGSYVLDH